MGLCSCIQIHAGFHVVTVKHDADEVLGLEVGYEVFGLHSHSFMYHMLFGGDMQAFGSVDIQVKWLSHPEMVQPAFRWSTLVVEQQYKFQLCTLPSHTGKLKRFLQNIYFVSCFKLSINSN